MKKLANFVKRDNKGFTLVEIIVVLAILAILIAVALPSMTGILNDSKGKVLMQDARAALIAYQLKRTDMPTGDITGDLLLPLIDKTGETTVSITVREITKDGATKAVALAYGDFKKVSSGKAVGIVSQGTEDDVATVYDTFAKAVDGITTATTGATTKPIVTGKAPSKP